MKLIHLSDLHIGKRVNQFSMIEDQKYILNEMLQIIEKEEPEGILIAGDVYDKSIPSAEAVQVFDDFLVRLSQGSAAVFMISGNHDSAERLAFASRIMQESGIYVSPVYDGQVEPITLQDEWGPVNLYLLPFLKPVHVKHVYPQEEIDSYTSALEIVIREMKVDWSQRNVLVTHQFVTGAARCESEELTVGGTDNVEASVFSKFDYVALGHLHGPQNVGQGHIRYCGTPLKYSFSEAGHQKSMTIAELKDKGQLSVRTVDLTPMRDMKKIKGTYMEVTGKSFYASLNREDYFHITLTDEEDIPDAVGRLRAVYPNLMKLEYDNQRTRNSNMLSPLEDRKTQSPKELFADFYKAQNNQEMDREQQEFVARLIDEIWEEKE